MIGRDYVFHPATVFTPEEDDPYKYYEAAVTGSKNVLESVVKAKVMGTPIKKTVATMSLFSITNLCGIALKCPKVCLHFCKTSNLLCVTVFFISRLLCRIKPRRMVNTILRKTGPIPWSQTVATGTRLNHLRHTAVVR